jgi:hypothetical protein
MRRVIWRWDWMLDKVLNSVIPRAHRVPRLRLENLSESDVTGVSLRITVPCEVRSDWNFGRNSNPVSPAGGWGSPGSWWSLRRVDIKIQKKKTVTKKVYHEETCETKTYTYSQTRTVTLMSQTRPPVREGAPWYTKSKFSVIKKKWPWVELGAQSQVWQTYCQ